MGRRVHRTLLTGESHGGDAFAVLGDFLKGSGSTSRNYDANSRQSRDLKFSAAGRAVRAQIADAGYRNIRGGISTSKAFLNSIRNPLNGTQFQVGAFSFTAVRKGNRMNVTVTNYLTVHSFLYHYSEWPANISLSVPLMDGYSSMSFNPLQSLPKEWYRNSMAPMSTINRRFTIRKWFLLL